MRWGRRRAIAVAGVVLLLLGLAGAHAAGLDRLPDVDSVMRSGLPNDTLVYDRTGTVLLADIQRPGAQHTDVPLAAMGRWLPAATVALDDPGFWSEPGVDAGRLARAAWDDVWGRRGGETGSTIVTRLVSLRLGPPAGAAARARAAALAVRVAAAVPRARILERYLNSLPYGNGAVGVEAAAITYFQVDAGQLDLAQASLLAGLPAAPTRLDPLRNLAGAKDRQRQVLDAMVRDRLVSRQEAELALGEPLHLVGPAPLDVAPVLVHQVVAELTRRYGADAVTARGFTVLSTLDWGLQQQADLALRQALDASRARHVTAGALAAVDPRTGEILALADAGTSGRYDFATAVPRSPGTAFRVFTYAAAIAGRAYTMVTPVDDAPISVDMDAGKPSYRASDSDRRDHGPCELRACAGNDRNVPAVRVELTIGVPAVVETARALGAPPVQPHFQPNGDTQFVIDGPASSFGPSLTLGGYGETPLRMATGLGTLANGGSLHQPEAILRLTRPDGGVVFQARPGAGTSAFDPGAAFVVSQMLADDADRATSYGSGSALALPGRHAAALAGTAENFSDAWAAGYTPSLAAAVWMGNPGYSFMTPGADGISVAAPAWHRFMQAALDQMGKGDEWYTPPAGVQAAMAGGRPAWFLPGTSASTPAPPPPASVHPA